MRISLVLFAFGACGSAASNTIDAGDDATAGELSIEPSNFAFEDTTLSESSAAQEFVVTNNGVAVTQLTTSTSGETGEFTIMADSCNNGTLAPDGSCKITVVFSPTDATRASGQRSAQLTVRDTVSAATSVAGVSGTSLDPKLTMQSSGSGSGDYTFVPAATGDCGTNCTRHPPGKVTITPVPDNGSGFSIWTLPCAGRDACEITLDQNRTISGEFALYRQVNVTVGFFQGVQGRAYTSDGKINCGANQTLCTAQYLEGDLVLINVDLPAPGANVRWDINGSEQCPGSATCGLNAAAQTNTVNITFQ